MLLGSLKMSFLKVFANFKMFKYPFFLIYASCTHEVKATDYYVIRDTIQAGDILLNGYRNYLDSYFILGKYSHLVLYMGDEKIIHAMPDLVSSNECGRVAVIRPKVSNVDKRTVMQRVLDMEGKPYDYDF